jgi:uncharacterized membrane protein YdjX (TVP38/TMEM64 family)
LRLLPASFFSEVRYYERMMEQMTAWLAAFSAVVPLELFVFAGSIIEEIIAPIPSILITSIAGTLYLDFCGFRSSLRLAKR